MPRCRKCAYLLDDGETSERCPNCGSLLREREPDSVLPAVLGTVWRRGAEAALAHQPQVEAALHLGLLNRGWLIAPFHNMMLVSPATTKRQIDRLIASFDEILTDLFA